MQGNQDIYVAKYSLAIFIVSLVLILEKKFKVYQDLEYFMVKYPMSYLIGTELVYYWIREMLVLFI